MVSIGFIKYSLYIILQMATGGSGVRGRKRRSPYRLGGHDTILQRLICPAVCQKETFIFYMTFYV